MRVFALIFFFTVSFLSCFGQGQQIASLATDTLGKKIIIDIAIEGNNLTKNRVILREVTLVAGDSLHWANIKAGIEQSKSNLKNLNLFNFVEIEPLQVGQDQIILLISVQERWYIYPIPILEIAQTNFNTWWETKEIRWLNYGMSLKHYNFRGLNQKVSLTARFGYTKKFSASWSIPNFNKKQTLSLYFNAGYYENDEITYNTFDNKRVFYRNNEDKARTYSSYKAGIGYRENIFLRHYFELAYYDAKVRDTVMTTLQPNYFVGTDNRMQYLRASYTISYDTRDYKKYPLKGMLLFGSMSQDGLGLVNKDGLSLPTTYLSYRQHYKLSDKFYLGHALSGKANWTDPPYYLMNGLGYNNFLRGYEYYVIDGTRWGLFQSNLKFELLKPKEFRLPVIGSAKFNKTFVAIYANWFVDVGYVDGKDFRDNNSLVNEYLYSTGIGLDLVTYYDRVFRLEGSINAMGESGIFIHFKQSF